MVQNDPDNMQPPTERTVVKIAYDDRSVYVGGDQLHEGSVEDHDRARPPRHVSAQRLDQDHVRSAPRSPDRATPSMSNPHGVQGDMTWFDDTRSSTDYDAVWDVRTQIHQDGWTRGVPHSVFAAALQPHARRGRGLGLQRPPRHRLQRGDRSAGWPRRAARRGSSRASATSRSRQPPAPPRRLEVQPFTLARQEHVTATGYGSRICRAASTSAWASARRPRCRRRSIPTSARSSRIRRCST